MDKPKLVVDIGSGTGLSTRIWAGRAIKAVGVEPNADMRTEAKSKSPACENVRYIDGSSTCTGLSDACADIVTCVQSLHWMEPEPTFAEIARILRPDGVFAAIECDWPPVVHWQLDAQWESLRVKAEQLQKTTGIYDSVKRWPKSEHLERMRKSERFRYTREIYMHQIDSGNAQRYIGLLFSQGGIVSLLKRGLSEEDIKIDELRELAMRVLGERIVPWYYSYRIRFGIK